MKPMLFLNRSELFRMKIDFHFLKAFYSQTLTESACEPDWIKNGAFCYYFSHNTRLPFNEAQSDCQDRGANLTSIHSDVEQHFLACKLHVLVESSNIFDLFKVNISYYIESKSKHIMTTMTMTMTT